MSDAGAVVGADGCPGGWLAVAMPPERPDRAAASIVADEADLVRLGAPIAIDMPIGLMDRPADGRRPADVAARRFLAEHNLDGVRGAGSRVFSSPTREHLAFLTEGGLYRGLLDAFPAGARLSKQCYQICPKIIEIDTLCRADPDGPFYECHPEVAFAAQVGRTLPSKHSAEGRAVRVSALRSAGFEIETLQSMLPKGRAYWRPDDLFDACQLALSAARMATGRSSGLPNLTDRDSLGLRRVIHY